MLKIGENRDRNKAPCRHCGYWKLSQQLLRSNVTGSCNAYTFPCWLYRIWEGVEQYSCAHIHQEEQTK